MIPHSRDRADGVLQVVRCGPVYALVDQYAQLVLDALRYAQPVKVFTGYLPGAAAPGIDVPS